MDILHKQKLYPAHNGNAYTGLSQQQQSGPVSSVRDPAVNRYPLQQNTQLHNNTQKESNPATHPLVTLHKSSKSVLHVRENSLDELDALFDPAKWSNRKQNALPLAKRNLPQSFFRPPESGGTKTPKLAGSSAHSRQNSIDQTSLLNNSSNAFNQQLLQQKLSKLNSSLHSRSVSEPVAVMPPYLMAQQQQAFQSNQSNLPMQPQQIQNHTPLPYGWQSARTQTGQQYFIK